MSVQVKMTGVDNVFKKMRGLSVNTIKNAVVASQHTAASLENHSVRTAPWTDRTGNARASIYAYSTLNSRTIEIYHGIRVDYGVYLELSYGGKYRVITPSTNLYRSIWVSDLNGILEA